MPGKRREKAEGAPKKDKAEKRGTSREAIGISRKWREKKLQPASARYPEPQVQSPLRSCPKPLSQHAEDVSCPPRPQEGSSSSCLALPHFKTISYLFLPPTVPWGARMGGVFRPCAQWALPQAPPSKLQMPLPPISQLRPSLVLTGT